MLSHLSTSKIGLIALFGLALGSGLAAGEATARPFGGFAAPAMRPNAGITSANRWLSGGAQPHQRYRNAGITSANRWLSGGAQPYQNYPNAGITSANCFLSGGCSQPYQQYKNVINP